MQIAHVKAWSGIWMIVLAIALGGLAIDHRPAQAQEGEVKVFLPVMGGQGFFEAVAASDQMDAASEATVEAAGHYWWSKCRTRTFGLRTVVSQFSFDETVVNLKAEIEARPLNLVAEINHADNAANIDQELRPTTLLLFGNPAVGTPLMQSDQTIGIDLPQKFLVWEDECGTVRIGYNAPKYLKIRHAIRDRNENFENIATVLKTIATAAATP